MKNSRFTESQIVSILKETDAGAKVTEVCRRHRICDATYYIYEVLPVCKLLVCIYVDLRYIRQGKPNQNTASDVPS